MPLPAGGRSNQARWVIFREQRGETFRERRSLDRLYVRGLDNVHEKFLIQAAACNLGLLMCSMYGSGKPRASHDNAIELLFAFLALRTAFDALWEPQSANFGDREGLLCYSKSSMLIWADLEKNGRLDTGC